MLTPKQAAEVLGLSARIRKAALGPAPLASNALLMDWLPLLSFLQRGGIRDFATHRFHTLSITSQRTLLLFIAEALESQDGLIEAAQERAEKIA